MRAWSAAIARILRKVAARAALGEVTLPVTVGVDELRDYLGRPRFTPETVAAPSAGPRCRAWLPGSR